MKNQRDILFKIFSSQNDISNMSTYSTVCKLLADNPEFQAVHQDNRYAIYLDYISHLEKIEKVAYLYLRNSMRVFFFMFYKTAKHKISIFNLYIE